MYYHSPMNLTLLTILIALLLTALALFVSSPCYNEDSDKCSGHKFAQMNDLKSADDCKYANRPHFESDVSEEFMRGCRKAFK